LVKKSAKCSAGSFGKLSTPKLSTRASTCSRLPPLLTCCAAALTVSKPEICGDLAVSYTDIAVTLSGTKYRALLPVRPMNGSRSITNAVDNAGQQISIRQSFGQNQQINVLSPVQSTNSAIVIGEYLVFNGTPVTPLGAKITSCDLNIIAEFNSMDDDDFVEVEGNEFLILKEVLNIMGYSNQIPQDILNNLIVDRERK